MDSKMKNKIMNEIKGDKIKMKARWVYIAKKIGLESGLALSILVLVFLINAFFYYIKSNGLLLPLHYGTAVWQKLLHSLPYDLIMLIVILFVLLNYFIKRFDFSYKRSFVFIFSLVFISIIIFASALSASNFNHALRGHFERIETKVPYVSDFYIHRCCQEDRHMMDFNSNYLK